MAERPIFVPNADPASRQLVQEISVEFHWHPGLAVSQKQKSIHALHTSAADLGVSPVLEISTKSEDPIGQRLSAFNLSVKLEGRGAIPLESAFQGSKKFLNGGPYGDLYGQSGFDIRKDDRIKTSGPLTAFVWENETWALEPKTAFYDWLYCHALHEQTSFTSHVLSFSGFSDIEFNPKKSINCQARACALYVALSRRELLKSALSDRSVFLELLRGDSYFQEHSVDLKQGKLF